MAAMIVGLLNFVLFMAGATYFGGDAVNGRAGGGRYFLWGPHDGTKGYHEVSRAIFLYSKWHTISMLVTWVLMLVAAFVYERIGKNSQS
jgi:hypothetical protein